MLNQREVKSSKQENSTNWKNQMGKVLVLATIALVGGGLLISYARSDRVDRVPTGGVGIEAFVETVSVDIVSIPGQDMLIIRRDTGDLIRGIPFGPSPASP